MSLHDRRALLITLFATAVFGPAQAIVFARLSGVPLEETVHALAARCLQVLVLTVACCVEAEAFANRRSEALLALFALLWALHIEANRRLLELGAHNPFVPAFIAVCVAVALMMHSALPIDRERIAPDLLSYALAAVGQGAACRTALPVDEAVRFAALLGLGLALAVLLRVALWLSAISGGCVLQKADGDQKEKELLRRIEEERVTRTHLRLTPCPPPLPWSLIVPSFH